MRRILHSDNKAWRFEIGKGTAASASGTILSFRDQATALVFLRSHASERNLCTLRHLLAESLVAPTHHRWSNREVLEQISWRLVWQHFSITAVPVAYSVFAGRPGQSIEDDVIEDAPIPAPTAPTPQPPTESQEALPWVTFQVIDDETEEPLTGIPLRLRLPDGSVSEFTTDASGTVHIAEVEPGTCSIEDMLDSDALEVVAVA